jgi:hypothetical protein
MRTKAFAEGSTPAGNLPLPFHTAIGRPQTRRLNPAGSSFAGVGGGELLRLLLPFKAMLLLERARGGKSGGPSLLAPSFKVQRDSTHSQSSGSAVAPGSTALTHAVL